MRASDIDRVAAASTVPIKTEPLDYCVTMTYNSGLGTGTVVYGPYTREEAESISSRMCLKGRSGLVQQMHKYND